MDVCGIRDHRAERALDHALRTDLTNLGRMWLLYDQEWTRGRRGIALLRGHLVERTPGRAPSDGELADLMWGIVRSRRLPEPIAQHPVKLPSGLVVHLDYAYPEAMLAIETDGYAYHQDRRSFELDRERDAELQLLGWTTLRLTWSKLRFDPDYVERLLRHHLCP